MAALLILGCSAAKRRDDGLLPAIERYNGTLVKVVRRAMRERPDPDLRIWFISAAFGAIAASEPIPWYDQQMTPVHAQRLRAEVHATLALQFVGVQRCFLALGRVYKLALFPIYLERAWGVAAVETAYGGIGQQAYQLHQWLRRIR